MLFRNEGNAVTTILHSSTSPYSESTDVVSIRLFFFYSPLALRPKSKSQPLWPSQSGPNKVTSRQSGNGFNGDPNAFASVLRRKEKRERTACSKKFEMTNCIPESSRLRRQQPRKSRLQPFNNEVKLRLGDNSLVKRETSWGNT